MGKEYIIEYIIMALMSEDSIKNPVILYDNLRANIKNASG